MLRSLKESKSVESTHFPPRNIGEEASESLAYLRYLSFFLTSLPLLVLPQTGKVAFTRPQKVNTTDFEHPLSPIYPYPRTTELLHSRLPCLFHLELCLFILLGFSASDHRPHSRRRGSIAPSGTFGVPRILTFRSSFWDHSQFILRLSDHDTAAMKRPAEGTMVSTDKKSNTILPPVKRRKCVLP